MKKDQSIPELATFTLLNPDFYPMADLDHVTGEIKDNENTEQDLNTEA